jgi:hypothetical protein
MVLISHRYKFIYIKCIKVASTSVEAFFRRYCLPEDQEATYEIVNNTDMIMSPAGVIGRWIDDRENKIELIKDRCNAHEPIYSLYKGMTTYCKLTRGELDSYYKFCIVRNPWDVQVSMYYYINKRRDRTISFEEHLKKSIVVNSKLYSISGKPMCDFYIRYENLIEDIETLCKTLNLKYDITKLPNYNCGMRPSTDYRSMYNEETKAYVATICAKEIEMFKYAF